MILPYRIWIALAQGDLVKAEELLTAASRKAVNLRVFELPLARLDPLVTLGRWEDVEREAAPLLLPGSYLEPFAQRALGAARGDQTLLEQAAARFKSIGLRSQTERTQHLAHPR